MPDIFDEVEEELRSERIQQFFARYGWAMLVAVIVIVVGIGGWRWREARLAHADQVAATEYLIAGNAASVTGANAAKAHATALAMFENIAANGPSGYQTLARLRAAALLAEDGKVPAALHLYETVAADQSADPLLRSLATILWAQRQTDTGNPQLLKARLEPLAVAGNPWRPLAQQEIALLDIREKRTDEARTILRGLAADPTAPSSIRDTAALLLDRLGS